MKIGLISGRAPPNLINNSEDVTVETVYGSVEVKIAEVAGHEVFFVGRHGSKGNLPPHKVNYRGNIQALSVSHVNYIISVGTVGSLNKNMKPGHMVIPHDFIDITKNRNYSFYDDKRVHVDMSNPFCTALRDMLIAQSKKIKSVSVHDDGVYLVTEGPRLETPAEIALYKSYADVVGMTLAPEVILAREKGVCYASLCVVCNMAAGFQKGLPASEIAQVYDKIAPMISTLIRDVLIEYDSEEVCGCQADLAQASL